VYYRNLIGLKGLSHIDSLNADDLIIVLDADELLHPNFLWVLKWHDGYKTSINLRLLWSYYSFRWVNPVASSVNGVVSVRELSLAGNLTNGVRFNLLDAKDTWTTPTPVGWHCSWCMPTARFLDKMAHFAHSELNQVKFRDVQWLESMRSQGLWFPDSAPNGCIQSSTQLPAYVAMNVHRFGTIC
jgi:hypothetical protein